MTHHTRLLLVRHGQARATDGSYGHATPLSALGRSQAARIADALAQSTPLAAIYASPYPRALETAMPLCDLLGVVPMVDPRLAEFELESNTFEAAQQRPDLVIWRPEHRGVAHGETLGAFSARVAGWCKEIVGRHVNTCVAVFAHSGTIDAALRWMLGLAPDSPWQHEFNLATASITEVEIWPHGRVAGGAPRYAALNRIGDVAHLGDLVSDL